MKLTGTNRPITYTTHPLPRTRFKRGSHHGGRVQRNKTACVHYVVPRQQTRCSANQQLNKQHHSCNTRFPATRAHQTPGRCGARVTAVIAWGKRPVPFRTRKLRPTAPMVLHPGGCGRVGHRRNIITRSRTPNHVGGPPAFKAQPGNFLPWTQASTSRTSPHQPRRRAGRRRRTSGERWAGPRRSRGASADGEI